MPRPKIYDETLRLTLLDRAGELLSAEGPHALSLRRLAAEAGTSTTAVYSLFGGKQELVQALFVEAFRRFQEALAAVPVTDDPLADLLGLGRAYRANALANPHLYAIMFGRPVPDFTPDESAEESAAETFQPLLATVQRAVEAGALRPDPPETIAHAAWALVHGLVSLELNAPTPPHDQSAAAIFESALRALVAGWRPAPAEGP